MEKELPPWVRRIRLGGSFFRGTSSPVFFINLKSISQSVPEC